MPDLSPSSRAALVAVFNRAQELGLLGPVPVSDHIDHALRFAAVLGEPPRRFADLGSGAGVPGFVLALIWPEAEVFLIDAMVKRCVFLRDSAASLEVADRVHVVEGRTEAIARDPQYDGSMDVVTARSFAPPAVTAECATRFLTVGGVAVVSEPPEAESRWPTTQLEELQLRPRRSSDSGIAVLEKIGQTPDRYPRRVGIPEKRPLF